MRVRTPADALRSAIAGASAVLAGMVLVPEAAAIGQVGMMLGAWLCLSALVQWRRLRRAPPRLIPIAFLGTTGPFRLRVRSRGREVTIHRGWRVVAMASAARWRDRLVVHPDGVEDAELEALGVAIGQAIQVVAGDAAVAGAERPTHARPHDAAVKRGREDAVGLPPARVMRRVEPRPSRGSSESPHRPSARVSGRRTDGNAYRPLVGLTRQDLARWRPAQQISSTPSLLRAVRAGNTAS